MSDSNGCIYDPEGIRAGRGEGDQATPTAAASGSMPTLVPGSEYPQRLPRIVWSVPCDMALPCATQNEIARRDGPAAIVRGGAMVAGGGRQHAQHPCRHRGAAGGRRACSPPPRPPTPAAWPPQRSGDVPELRMRLAWTFDEVDQQACIRSCWTSSTTSMTPPWSTASPGNLVGRVPTSPASARWRTPCWRRVSVNIAFVFFLTLFLYHWQRTGCLKHPALCRSCEREFTPANRRRSPPAPHRCCW